MKVILFQFLVFLKFSEIYGTNLLFLSGVASKSHLLWTKSLIGGLLASNKDYNVTVVTPDTDKNPLPNMHYIQLEKVYETIYSTFEFNLMDLGEESKLMMARGLFDYSSLVCKGIIQSEGLNQILNYTDDFKFDAIIYDFLCGPCLLPLLHKFKYPPLIGATAFSNPIFKTELIGGHIYPAYVPHYILGYDNKMNFFQRLINTFFYKMEIHYRNDHFMPELEAMVRDRFNYKDMPSLMELERKMTIMLLNQHPAVDFAEPVQPNLIQVGGLQIVEPKPLKEDLKNFIEAGKKGTVIMSLGTNIRSDMLSKEILTSIIQTFKEIPEYNFIWKFESDELPVELPANVKVLKFLPQNSILAHPHVKAFITHGGLMSTQESLWYGKPMIGIPFFADQYSNLGNSVKLGTAEIINHKEITVQSFKEIILRILKDPKYTENTQRISKQFQDQPERPLKRAVWWVEYILRNPNPVHLQSPTLKLGKFISDGNDILLFLAIIVGSVIFLIYKSIRCIKKCRCSQKTSVPSSKKSN